MKYCKNCKWFNQEEEKTGVYEHVLKSEKYGICESEKITTPTNVKL